MYAEDKLFNDEEPHSWKKEWQDMPEFEQIETRIPYVELIVRFANEEDLQAFAKLINQRLTCLTKSTWYPRLAKIETADKEYTDEGPTFWQDNEA